MKRLLYSLMAVSSVAAAAGPQWTWEAGKQTNDGSITVRSVSGAGTYSVTQNPTGAVARTNQSAVTQPPTIILQATSGGPVFNYTTDCYRFAAGGTWQLGAGKYDSGTGKFTGISARHEGDDSLYVGATHVVAILTGVPSWGYGSTSADVVPVLVNCGSDAGCVAAKTSQNNPKYNKVATVKDVPVTNVSQCY